MEMFRDRTSHLGRVACKTPKGTLKGGRRRVWRGDQLWKQQQAWGRDHNLSKRDQPRPLEKLLHHRLGWTERQACETHRAWVGPNNISRNRHFYCLSRAQVQHAMAPYRCHCCSSGQLALCWVTGFLKKLPTSSSFLAVFPGMVSMRPWEK